MSKPNRLKMFTFRPDIILIIISNNNQTDPNGVLSSSNRAGLNKHIFNSYKNYKCSYNSYKNYKCSYETVMLTVIKTIAARMKLLC